VSLGATQDVCNLEHRYPHKTLFHEIAHVLLGHVGEAFLTDDQIITKSLREAEAEGVALLCCDALGLEGAESCRGYIQHWLAGDGIPEKSAQRIMRAAATILKAGIDRTEQAEIFNTEYTEMQTSDCE